MERIRIPFKLDAIALCELQQNDAPSLELWVWKVQLAIHSYFCQKYMLILELYNTSNQYNISGTSGILSLPLPFLNYC